MTRVAVSRSMTTLVDSNSPAESVARRPLAKERSQSGRRPYPAAHSPSVRLAQTMPVPVSPQTRLVRAWTALFEPDRLRGLAGVLDKDRRAGV